MRNLAAPGWLFAFGLLAAGPAAAVAQNDTGQPVGQEDNTSYGTTSAEFLLLGAGARGTALGGSFAAIATDISALYYNPAGAALIEKAGLRAGDTIVALNGRARPDYDRAALGALLRGTEPLSFENERDGSRIDDKIP
jgi:hypothetical protein